MKRTIYFVRHSEPDLNVIDDLTRPLTIEGHHRLKNVVSYFEKIKIDNVFSSPYKRCIDTVKPIAKSKELEIVTVDDFRERKVSDGWIDDFKTFAMKQWQDFNYKLKNGESLNDTQKRNVKALNGVLTQKWETIVIGTHGTALSSILNYYFKDFGYQEFQSIKVEFPFICKVEVENEIVINYEIIKTN